MKVGIEGLTFDSAHYTLSSKVDDQIHGHTYIVSVEIDGEIDDSTGFVVDFNELDRVAREVVKEWDHVFIIPKADLDKIDLHGPFKKKLKVIEHPFPTAEYIAIDIARTVFNRLKPKGAVRVKIYEGVGKYAEILYP